MREFFTPERAREPDVLVYVKVHKRIVEDLVVVRVEVDVMEVFGGEHEAVPGRGVLEAVGYYNADVGVRVTNNSIAIVVELLEWAELHATRYEGLVEKFDGCHDVGLVGVTLCECADGIQGLGHCLTLLPVDGTTAAAVVEAVLGARG